MNLPKQKKESLNSSEKNGNIDINNKTYRRSLISVLQHKKIVNISDSNNDNGNHNGNHKNNNIPVKLMTDLYRYGNSFDINI